MNFITEAHTDVGIKKKTNQDSVLILEADTEYGNIALAAICDGMGGLANGEVASASLVKAYAAWFQEEFPFLLSEGMGEDAIRQSLETVVKEKSRQIMEYGRRTGATMGTTLVLLLLAAGRYYILNVGDSRAYKIGNRLVQLTKDQTYVQREMDMGRMTAEQALTDPQRNALLQCVGARDYLEPDFYSGTALAGENFMLCSDGFRHIITEEELYQSENER